MSLTLGGRTRAASFPRGSVLFALLLATSVISFGQEVKAAATLGFSVNVLSANNAQFLSPRLTALAEGGTSRSVQIPLSSESMAVGSHSATLVIARFQGYDGGASGLSGRIDGSQLQELLPGDGTASSVMIVPRMQFAAGRSSRNRIIELNWKTARTEDTSNLLEIEIRQY